MSIPLSSSPLVLPVPARSFVLEDDAIAAAAARIGAVLAPTPVIFSTARRAFLKLENLQVTGAYKVRGAFNAVAARWERGLRTPLVAASAGNHGLGVAWAARHFHLPATIVVPAGAPRTKIEGCLALGARVVTGGSSVEHCLQMAAAHARASGGHLVHPFDDLDVIAGQATVGLELLALEPDVVLLPVGGGGLAAGAGTVLRRHGVRVVGVQVRGVDALRRVLAGEAPTVAPATLADGLRVTTPGQLTTPICAQVLDDLVLVDEAQLATTIASLVVTDKVVAEGAGAASVAALLAVSGKRRVAVVSGGNIDAGVLARLLRCA
jgi:threonine dehydratase